MLSGSGRWKTILQAAGVEMLRAILSPILLRRTKRSLIDGRPIVALPPRCGTLARAAYFSAHALWLCRVCLGVPGLDAGL